MVEVGDHVLVESEKVGSVTRRGVVTAVEDRLITVRWDTGSESVFVPSSGSLRGLRWVTLPSVGLCRRGGGCSFADVGDQPSPWLLPTRK
jgi:Domain of unknown function (DUF1918)